MNFKHLLRTDLDNLKVYWKRVDYPLLIMLVFGSTINSACLGAKELKKKKKNTSKIFKPALLIVIIGVT